MVDFHTHILPNMDDGAESLEMSLEMIKDSYYQGIDTICATPHFNAYEESISSFIKRRDIAYKSISEYVKDTPVSIRLGSEVLYFPGMAECEGLNKLTLEGTNLVLIEPPMNKWSNYVISEIEAIKANLKLQPVIAHLDRYMVLFDNYSLISNIDTNRCKIQFNVSFFIENETRRVNAFLPSLMDGTIGYLGSDCHNMTRRRQNFENFFQVMNTFKIDIINLDINKY